MAVLMTLLWMFANNNFYFTPQPDVIRGDIVTLNAYGAAHINQNAYRWNNLTSVTLGETTYQAVAFWNSSGKLVIGKRILDGLWTFYVYDGTGGLSNITVSGGDNHDTCTIGFDPNGYLHIAYDMHDQALKYRKSDAAIDSWTGGLTTTLSMLGTNEDSVTYPTFINDPSGNLYFLYRDGASGNGNLNFYKYLHATTTWAAAIGTFGVVINGKANSVNPYWDHPVFDADFGSGGYMHLSWHWRLASGSFGNEDECYVKWDGTNWYQADGTAQTTPITRTNCETIDDMSENRGKTSFNATFSDSNGNPHIVYPKTDVDGYRYLFHAYHNGSSWTITKITSTQNASLGDNDAGDKGLNPSILIDRSTDTVYILYRDFLEQPGIWLLKSTNFVDWTKSRVYPYEVGWWVPKFDYVEFERSGGLYFLIEMYWGGTLSGAQNKFPIYLWKVDPSTW